MTAHFRTVRPLTTVPPTATADLTRVRRALRDSFETAAEIARRTNMTPSMTYHMLRRLCLNGDAECQSAGTGPARYRRAPDMALPSTPPSRPSPAHAAPPIFLRQQSSAQDIASYHLSRINTEAARISTGQTPATWAQIAQIAAAADALEAVT